MGGLFEPEPVADQVAGEKLEAITDLGLITPDRHFAMSAWCAEKSSNVYEAFGRNTMIRAHQILLVLIISTQMGSAADSSDPMSRVVGIFETEEDYQLALARASIFTKKRSAFSRIPSPREVEDKRVSDARATTYKY